LIFCAPGTRTAVAERKRRALGTGAAVFAVFIVYPVLAAFTPVLDGTVGGIGVAYLVGAAEIMLAFGLALAVALRKDEP
jgi:uncharacterized membrane protein (DUF485 family)